MLSMNSEFPLLGDPLIGLAKWSADGSAPSDFVDLFEDSAGKELAEASKSPWLEDIALPRSANWVSLDFIFPW